MKRLITKSLAFLMVLTLLLSLLPLSVMAQSADGSAESQELVGSAANNGPTDEYAYIEISLTKGDGYSTVVFSVEKNIHRAYGDKAVYDKETNTLTLNNLNAYALDINEMGEDFKIIVNGYNTLSYITVWGFGWGGSAFITGDGTLDLSMGLGLEAEDSDSVLTIDKNVTLLAHGQGVYVYDTTAEVPMVIKGKELSGGVPGYPKKKYTSLKYEYDESYQTTASVYRNTTKPFADNSRFKDVEYFAVYGLGATETREEDGEKHHCYKFVVNEAVQKNGEYLIGSHITYMHVWDDSLLYKMYSSDLDSMEISDLDPDYVKVDLDAGYSAGCTMLDKNGRVLYDVAIVPKSSDSISRPSVTTVSLPDAVEGRAYSAQITAQTGNQGGRITGYSLKGTAAKWLTIDSSGNLSGTAPDYGIYEAVVTATEEVNGQRAQSAPQTFTIKADIPDVCATFQKTISNGCAHTLTVTDSKKKVVKTVSLGTKDLRPDTVIDLSDLGPGSYTATLTGVITGAEAIYYNNSEAFTVKSGTRTLVTLDPDIEMDYGENTFLLTVTNIRSASELKDLTATVTLNNAKVYKKEVVRTETLFPDLSKDASISKVTLTAKDDAGQEFEIASGDSDTLTIDTALFKTYRAYCYQSDIQGIRLSLNGHVFDMEAMEEYTFMTLDEDHLPQFVGADFTEANLKKYRLEPEITLGAGSAFYVAFERLDMSAALSGTVKDETGKTIAEVPVACSQSVNGKLVSFSAITDDKGKYKFSGLYADTAASVSAAKYGYSDVQKALDTVTAGSTCNLKMQSVGGVTVYTSDYVYDAKITWSGAASGSMTASNGYTFVLPIKTSVNGSVTVTMTASNITGKATGTVTVKNGKGTVTLQPVLKGSIDWSGQGDNASYTGYSLKIEGKNYSRLFAPQSISTVTVDAGEYTVKVLEPNSNDAYSTQKLKVKAAETAYVSVSLPAEAQQATVSSGKLTGPGTASNGETYQLKGLLTSIDGTDLTGLKFAIGDSYSWSDNIQHVVVNGKKAKISNGIVYKKDNKEIDWSLPLNFTVYCTQRADATDPSQTVSAYVMAGKTSLIGSVVTRYIPKMTLRTVRAVGSSKDLSDNTVPDVVSFVGQCEANTEVRLYDNGTLCAVVMTDDRGSYSGNLTLTSDSGSHTIRAEAKFGGETAAAQSVCTYRSDGAVLQSLLLNGQKIPINGSRLAYIAVPSGTVQFTANFKNAGMLDDITMTVNGETVTSKVFFKVSNISGYEILPATSDRSGDTWTSTVYAHGADYPTGVQTIYVNKVPDTSYTVTLSGDTASSAEKGADLASTGAGSTTFDIALERIDSYDKDNYTGAYDYKGWIEELTGDPDFLSDNSMSSAEKTSALFEKYAQKLNQGWGEDRASAITAKKAAERCPDGKINIRTYVDSPKYDVTAQNVQLRKTELEAKGYESAYYKDRTSGRELYVFTGSFYYDKNAQPVPELYVTNIYNGVPTVEEDKRMFDNGKPTGSTLDVTYVCDLKAKKWIRTQTAVISPGCASPIHTFSTQIPCNKEQPNEYKDYAVNPVSSSSHSKDTDTLVATGDPDMHKLAAGSNISIDFSLVKPQSYAGLTLGVLSCGLGAAMNKGFLSTPTYLPTGFVEKMKVIFPETGKILEKMDYGSVTAAVVFKALGDANGNYIEGTTAPKQHASDFDYWQAYLTEEMKYYAHVEEVTKKTNASNNGGRMGDYRAEAVLAGYMKNRCSEMQQAFTELQAATEKVQDHFSRNENMTFWLGWGSMGMAILPEYGYIGAGVADGFSFLANASTDTHVARYNKAVENFLVKLKDFDKLDTDSRESFRYTDEVVERNRDKYPDTKTIQQLLEEAGYGDPMPTNPSKDDPSGNGEGSDDDCDLEPVHDPSGVVYEAVLSNPVEGATVTLYRYGGEQDPLAVWDDSDYLGQNNPLITDENGYYRWDVPEGEWYVTASKDGYAAGSSQNDKEATVKHGDINYLPVLPPQLDVNIPLVSYKAPEVESVSARSDGVYITFTKYMSEAELKADSFTLTDSAGKAVAFKLEKLDSEQAPANIRYGGKAPSYTRTVRLTASLKNGAALHLQIADTLRSYAGVAMTVPYNGTLTVKDKEVLNAPTFSVKSGEVEKGTLVTITCDKDAEIIYTTDGTDPTATNGTRIKSGDQVSVIIDTTLKAIAVRTDAKTSKITKAAYTVKKVQVPDAATARLLGDVDGDGKVTIVDVTTIQRHLASMSTSAYIEEVADIDGDKKVTILDATAIQRWLADMPAPEGIGEPI